MQTQLFSVYRDYRGLHEGAAQNRKSKPGAKNIFSNKPYVLMW